MSEHKLQVAVAKLLDASGLHYTAIPNGGNRNVVTGAMLKAEGVKRGWPDIAIMQPFREDVEVIHGVIRYGLFIELKDGPKGRVSSYQQACMERLEENGYKAVVCRSIDDVLKVLKSCYPEKFG